MPRKRKAARAFRIEKRHGTRQQIIRELVDDFPYPAVNSPLLAHISEDARSGLVKEALELFYTERHARRLPILRERLKNMVDKAWGGVNAWGPIFCEAPELEEQLTPEQRSEWQSWLAEVERRRKRETQENVVTMPAASEIQ